MSPAFSLEKHLAEIGILSEVNHSLLQGLAPFNVVLESSDAIEDYITNHADFGPLLANICARLRESFGQVVEISLELYSDPEQRDQYLVLYVRQEEYEAGILNRIESVTRPFMSQLEAVSGDLLVTTDFRRSRG